MKKHNSYRNKCKIKLMREAIEDFKKDFRLKPDTFFTEKDNFYFIKKSNKKYIHKKSLKMIYTNYDTYTYDLEPETCKIQKIFDEKDIFDFDLLDFPQTEHFYISPWIDGETVLDITKNDFYYLKNLYKDKTYTPFYNQMLFNLIKNQKGIHIIDYKHFEYKKDLPFFIYFYNKEYKINTLYYEKDLEKIKEHLKKDYPIQEAKNVRFTEK
jgi:hypothetical protein